MVKILQQLKKEELLVSKVYQEQGLVELDGNLL
jgi:hypothetical protein